MTRVLFFSIFWIFLILSNSGSAFAQCKPSLCVSGTTGVRVCTANPEQYTFPGDKCFSDHPNCRIGCQGGGGGGGGGIALGDNIRCIWNRLPPGRATEEHTFEIKKGDGWKLATLEMNSGVANAGAFCQVDIGPRVGTCLDAIGHPAITGNCEIEGASIGIRDTSDTSKTPGKRTVGVDLRSDKYDAKFTINFYCCDEPRAAGDGEFIYCNANEMAGVTGLKEGSRQLIGSKGNSLSMARSCIDFTGKPPSQVFCQVDDHQVRGYGLDGGVTLGRLDVTRSSFYGNSACIAARNEGDRPVRFQIFGK